MTIPNINLKELVEAGVHFGHKSQRWNPKMLKYIHSTRENIHIINLNYTVQMLSEALKVIDDVVSKGGKILFVATKKQAKDIISKSKNYLIAGMNIDILFDGDEILDVRLPAHVILNVDSTEPGFKGNTATGAAKPATVETGYELNVPLFVNENDKIKVDTRSGEYVERAKNN